MSAGLEILQHSLGLDEYGQGRAYRNYYVSGEGCTGWDTLLDLERRGLLKRHPMPSALTGGGVCFTVTEAGRRYIAEHSPKPPKLTRSQRRYRDFIAEDCGLRFGEWLRSRNHLGERP